MSDHASFWMVYGDGQSAPKAKHGSRSIAEIEATRLARNNPGIKFYVMEPVGMAEKVDVSFTRFAPDLDSEIPF